MSKSQMVPKIGENIPSQDVNISHLKIPKHLKLADPNFHVSNSVDMLIGAQLFYEILCIGQISLEENMHILQKTRYGWIISGPIVFGKNSKLHCNLNVNHDVQQQLAKFWELEEPSSLVPVMSEDNKRCEKIFVSTTTRGSDGKFQVVIPFRESVEKLADSRLHALSRFLSLENRLSRNPVLKRIGGESVEEVIKVCKEVDSILRSGCFVPCKWASNKSQVVETMAGSADPNVNIHFGEKEEIKIPGLYWSSNQDVLIYNITSSIYPTITKRTVLSDIARIFDPLGLLGPTIIKAKILLQKLWAEQLSWDESLPADIDYKWRHFRNELHLLKDLKIPRHVVYDKAARIELHGFSDASIEAFGACVYIRSISMDGHCQISLVLAKSKVAPIKSVTIPRLELCGSLVLAQIVNKAKLSMSITFDEVYLWCDSSVALSWISTFPHLLQTFVGNRVSQIQSLTEPNQWRHIRSEDNPADIVSRYQEKLCEKVENIFYCHNHLKTEENCIVNIIVKNEAKNCSTLPVHITNIIANQISSESILLTTPINTIITDGCSVEKHQDLQPGSYLITILDKCHHIINQEKFSSENEDLLAGKIIQLPELPSINMSELTDLRRKIKPNNMDIKELSHLTNKMNNHHEITLPMEPNEDQLIPT
ncbi:hypothetical protein NQ317_008021 [Molorchus minor]|uniref:Peptidase aspartic putative domain-containing protein n=1 Tax=Molorchus minor TaxID=1323400 RepID=A0ABQ9JX48_9CUCU|nr:hypothetical protein NQ317_008021 [Molorchus minor]